MKLSLIFIISFFAVTENISAQDSSVNEANAEIILNSFNPDSDTVINAGILITLKKDWHIYWLNPGDSGMPTSFQIKLPDDIKITEMQWPTPKIFEFEGYASYGYEDKVLFPFSILLPPGKNIQTLEIIAEIKSLICKDVCKPFNEEVKKVFELNTTYFAPPEIRNLFNNMLYELPEKNELLNIEVIGYSEKIIMSIISQRINPMKIKSAHFIPYENGIFKNSLNQLFTIRSDSIELIVEYDQFNTLTPHSVEGILILEFMTEEGIRKSVYKINESLKIKNN